METETETDSDPPDPYPENDTNLKIFIMYCNKYYDNPSIKRLNRMLYLNLSEAGDGRFL